MIPILCAVLAAGFAAQTPLEVGELAQYRLTTAVLTRFAIASKSIGEVARADPALQRDPLFTREVTVLDDAPTAAAALETRLREHPALARALDEARLSARDYTKFALSLFAARLAHGFVKAGVLRRVPNGAASENVAFVEAHEPEITPVLADLGLDGQF